jgi:hypothetical protein
MQESKVFGDILAFSIDDPINTSQNNTHMLNLSTTELIDISPVRVQTHRETREGPT